MALHHLQAGEKVQLSSVASPDGGKTRALVKNDRFEAVQIVLHARDEDLRTLSAGIRKFAVPRRSSCTPPVPSGGSAQGWRLALSRSGGQKHSLKAIEDSSLLLTIMFD